MNSKVRPVARRAHGERYARRGSISRYTGAGKRLTKGVGTRGALVHRQTI